MIKIDFQINGFSDAIYLADDHSLTDAEIEAMKQARYDKWKDFIDNPPPAVDGPVDTPAVEE
jgi:putative sterol carrier protein